MFPSSLISVAGDEQEVLCGNTLDLKELLTDSSYMTTIKKNGTRCSCSDWLSSFKSNSQNT
jgi:hypothetical protein